jgi:hypothetical protein
MMSSLLLGAKVYTDGENRSEIRLLFAPQREACDGGEKEVGTSYAHASEPGNMPVIIAEILHMYRFHFS